MVTRILNNPLNIMCNYHYKVGDSYSYKVCKYIIKPVVSIASAIKLGFNRNFYPFCNLLYHIKLNVVFLNKKYKSKLNYLF